MAVPEFYSGKILYPAIAVLIGLSALFDVLRGNLIGLLIDALVIFLLTRPATRARFGVR